MSQAENVAVSLTLSIPCGFFGAEVLEDDELDAMEYEQVEAAVAAFLMQFTGKLAEDTMATLLEEMCIDEWIGDSEPSMMDRHEVEKYQTPSRSSGPAARSPIGEACSKCKVNAATAMNDGDPKCVSCLAEAWEAEDTAEGNVNMGVVRTFKLCMICKNKACAEGYNACTSCYLEGEGDEKCDHGVSFFTPCDDCTRAGPPSRINPSQSKYYCVHGENLAEECKGCNAAGRTILADDHPKLLSPPKEEAPPPPPEPLLELGGVLIMRKAKANA